MCVSIPSPLGWSCAQLKEHLPLQALPEALENPEVGLIGGSEPRAQGHLLQNQVVKNPGFRATEAEPLGRLEPGVCILNKHLKGLLDSSKSRKFPN